MHRFNVLTMLLAALWFSSLSMAQDLKETADVAPYQKVILVVGASGEDSYGDQFDDWAKRWEVMATESPGLKLVRIGPTVDQNMEKRSDWDKLKTELSSNMSQVERLWLVLIGHGTDDRKQSKFNLAGPDVSAKELAQWLQPIEVPVVVANCSSASGGFISKLKGKNRIVLTATKSGAQYNFARFGDYFSQAIADPALDLDKDQQTSLFEAFVAASKQTQDYYIDQKRLATELAILDDNGDGLGTPGDWFIGIRPNRQPKSGKLDGSNANRIILVQRGSEVLWSVEQRREREDLERRIEELRAQKTSLGEDEYYQRLESVLLQMAKLAERVESVQILQEDQVADELTEASQTEAADQDEAQTEGEKEEKGNGDGS